MSATTGAQTAAGRIRGDVVAVNGLSLQIKADGEKVVTVALADGTLMVDRRTVGKNGRGPPG